MSIRAIATGIGSVPFKDPRQAVEAIFRYFPQAPFWPQLPKRNAREGMVAQYSENFPGIKITDDGLEFSRKAAEDALEAFYEHIIALDLEYFKISEAYAAGLYEFRDALEQRGLSKAGFLKCHVTGPFTFAASISDESGVALIHDEVLMQAMVKGLVMKAKWQIKFFEKFGKPIIMFIDEPYLAGFGSAFTALTRETALKILDDFTSAVKGPEVLVGVHCCGNTDWSLFTDVPSIDIINFDAYGYLDKFVLYGKELAEFFKRGGYLCWGIVPTQEYKEGITRDMLVTKLQAGIEALVKKGADRSRVCEQLLLSPSCGLGTLEAASADKIFSLLGEISSFLRKSPAGR